MEVDQEEERLTHFDVAKIILSEMKLATIQETKEIREYRDGVFREKAQYKILKRIEQIMENNCTKNFREEVLEHIRIATYQPLEKFDYDEDILNLKNGLLHVHSGIVTEHTPDYLSLNQLPVWYDPLAKAKRFERFLSQILPDIDDRLLVLDHMAACLWRNPRLKKALLAYGDTDSGKSTLFNVLIALLGRENIADIALQDLEMSRFCLFNLVAKLANVYADIDKKELTQSRRFKTTTGGDRITVEKKFSQPFETYIYAKLFYSANQIPETQDESDAFFNRFNVVCFPRRFTDSEKDPELLGKLTQQEELSGILNILIARLRTIVRLGSIPNSQTPDEVRGIWLANSDYVRMFWNQHVRVDPNGEIEVNDLYSLYVDFCVKKKIRTKHRTAFKQKLESFGVYQFHTSRILNGEKVNLHFWKGISLKDKQGQLETEGKETNRKDKIPVNASVQKSDSISPFDWKLELFSTFEDRLETERINEEALSQFTKSSDGLFYCGFCEVYRTEEEEIRKHIEEGHFVIASEEEIPDY